ncbi:MAG TPA: EamA family transporter [Candidatus Limnocylindrales bacterium]|nr:EamA family transporter [Candidatus Limnocylindrales bacterium]
MSQIVERPARRPIAAAVPAPLLVLGGIVSVQVGAAVATGLIREVGPIVTVGIRLAVAAVVLLLLARPGVRGRSRGDWLVVLALGVSLGAMNVCFYGALGRLPLGIVTTIEFLGPLGLAAALSRRPAHLLAVLVALAGVVAVSGALEGGIAAIDTVGLLLTAAAGAGWACYILAARAVGSRWQQLDGLALAMAIGAVLVAPATAASWGGAGVTWAVVLAMAGVAVLSSVIPYSLELLALRRLDTRVFGVLLSVEPALAALAGFLLLGQRLSLIEMAGIGLVVVASALVMREQVGEPAMEAAEIG